MKLRLPVLRGSERIPKQDAPPGYDRLTKDPKEYVDLYRYGVGRPSLF